MKTRLAIALLSLFVTANPSIGGSVIGYREKRDFVVTLRPM